MRIRVVSSKEEINSLGLNEKIIHLEIGRAHV